MGSAGAWGASMGSSCGLLAELELLHARRDRKICGRGWLLMMQQINIIASIAKPPSPYIYNHLHINRLPSTCKKIISFIHICIDSIINRFKHFIQSYQILDQFTVQFMSLFFKEGSQVSEYQNTAFFQNGEASKASIFDNPPQSETQLAYDLFNESDEPLEKKDRSLISQLDLLDRRADFTQTPIPDQRLASKRDVNVESQESKDSRMTFGTKIHNKLKESKAEEPPKFYEERKEPSKPKPTPLAKTKPNEPSSNFSLFRQGPVVKEPDSMPVKLQNLKSTPKIFEAPSNSSSSTFSIDFEEIRQRNQLEVKPIAKQMTSLRLGNEREARDGKSESGRSERFEDNSLDSRFEVKEQQKEKKFGFTLRRSRAIQENKNNLQGGFCLKTYSPNEVATPKPIQQANPSLTPHNKSIKNQQRIPQTDEGMATPFKIKLKQTTKEPPVSTIITSNVKKIQPQRSNTIHRNFDERQAEPKPESKRIIESKPLDERQGGNDSTLDKEPSVRSDCHAQSKKRESIGLKEQLKKLTSRPTQRVELKSIAFNKSFKLKSKINDEKQTENGEQVNASRENNRGIGQTIQKNAQVEAKGVSKHFILKDDRPEVTPPKPKSTEFSKYMLILMQLQQESQTLKAKTVHSRNFYRELAILNDDINRRIDEVLGNNKR